MLDVRHGREAEPPRTGVTTSRRDWITRGASCRATNRLDPVHHRRVLGRVQVLEVQRDGREVDIESRGCGRLGGERQRIVTSVTSGARNVDILSLWHHDRARVLKLLKPPQGAAFEPAVSVVAKDWQDLVSDEPSRDWPCWCHSTLRRSSHKVMLELGTLSVFDQPSDHQREAGVAMPNSQHSHSLLQSRRLGQEEERRAGFELLLAQQRVRVLDGSIAPPFLSEVVLQERRQRLPVTNKTKQSVSSVQPCTFTTTSAW